MVCVLIACEPTAAFVGVGSAGTSLLDSRAGARAQQRSPLLERARTRRTALRTAERKRGTHSTRRTLLDRIRRARVGREASFLGHENGHRVNGRRDDPPLAMREDEEDSEEPSSCENPLQAARDAVTKAIRANQRLSEAPFDAECCKCTMQADMITNMESADIETAHPGCFSIRTPPPSEGEEFQTLVEIIQTKAEKLGFGDNAEIHCGRLEGINWNDPRMFGEKPRLLGNLFMVAALMGLREYLSNPGYIANAEQEIALPIVECKNLLSDPRLDDAGGEGDPEPRVARPASKEEAGNCFERDPAGLYFVQAFNKQSKAWEWTSVNDWVPVVKEV